MDVPYKLEPQSLIRPRDLFYPHKTGYSCIESGHIGVNNTTGRCPLCGEQLEQPSAFGFAKANYLGTLG